MATQARQPKVAKVLRVGILQDGKLVQQRLIRQGESVTVGGSEKCTFVVPGGVLPRAEYPILVAGRSGYVLNFTEQMKGKISSGGAIVGLDRLRNDPTVQRQEGSWRLPLTEHDKGKIALGGDGDVAVLFQFVPPPPTAPVKVQRSSDFRPRLLEEDDPAFLGFLALFAALAAVLLVWVWNTEPPKTRGLDEIPDRFTKILLPATEPEPTDLAIEKPDGERPEEKAPEEPSESSDAVADAQPKTAVERAKAREQLKEGVVERSLMLRYMTTRGENQRGEYAEDLLGEGDAGLEELDAAMARVTGVAEATSTNTQDLRAGATGGRDDADIGSLGGVGGGSSELAKGPEVKVTGSVEFGAPASTADGTDATAVRSVVQENQGQLQFCYEQQLKVDPKLGGRVEVEWVVRGGRVTSAMVFANTTGNKEFAECMVTRIRRWRFPEGVEGEILYPFIFTPRGG